MQNAPGHIALDDPLRKGPMSVQEALFERKSSRSFAEGELDRDHTSALLFAAQGITRAGGYRTAPSAGALYPLEVFLIAGRIRDIPPGAYRYVPYTHTLIPTVPGDLREQLARSAVGQMWAAQAPAAIAICAVYERVTGKYGPRGRQYVHIEAGTASQNIALAAAAMNIGTTVVGAFNDDEVARLIGANEDERPLIIQPAGPLR